MFDTITSGSGKGAAARKGSSFAFSVAMHGVAIALAVVFSVVKDKYGSKEGRERLLSRWENEVFKAPK